MMSPKPKIPVKIDDEAPPLKKPCTDKQNHKQRTSTQEESHKTKPPKRVKTQTGNNDKDCIYSGTVIVQ